MPHKSACTFLQGYKERVTTKVLSHNILSLYGFYISALHSLCSGATAKKRRVDTREHTPYTCVPTGNTKTYLDLYVTFRTSTRDAPRRSGPWGPPWGPLFFIFYFPLLPAPLKPPGRTHTERLNAFRLAAIRCTLRVRIPYGRLGF